MRAYSMDLRERALLDSDAGMKAADVAAKYRVSGSWVRLLKQRRRETGEVAPRVQRQGRRGMLEPHLHTLADLIAAHPDRTLAELKDALATPASVPTVWRAVRALGLTVKKKRSARPNTIGLTSRPRGSRGRVSEPTWDVAPLVFLDETGITTNLLRRYGRAPRGARVHDHAPCGRWQTSTFLAAWRVTGLTAPGVFDGAIDGESFRAYIEQILVPPPAARQHRHCRQSRGPQGRRHPTRHPGCRVRPRRDHWRGGPRASATSTGGVAAAARAPRLPPHGRAASPSGRKAGWRASVDDQSLIAIGVDRSVWLDARGEDVPGTLLGPVQRARVHGPVRRPVEPCRPGLPVANACLGQRAARPPAARASVGAVAVVALVVHGPAGPHGGAGAPAELALRTGALGRHSWLPTHRRPVAAAHSPCLSRPPERMWTDAACPRPPPRRDPAHDPAQNRLDRHPR